MKILGHADFDTLGNLALGGLVVLVKGPDFCMVKGICDLKNALPQVDS